MHLIYLFWMSSGIKIYGNKAIGGISWLHVELRLERGHSHTLKVYMDTGEAAYHHNLPWVRNKYEASQAGMLRCCAKGTYVFIFDFCGSESGPVEQKVDGNEQNDLRWRPRCLDYSKTVHSWIKCCISWAASQAARRFTCCREAKEQAAARTLLSCIVHTWRCSNMQCGV